MLLKNVSRKFIFLWLTELIGILGTGFTEFGLGVWIYSKTGKATPMAISVFCAVLPVVILSPVTGLIVDKFNKKLIIILSDVGAAIASILMLLLLHFDIFNLYYIYGIIVLNSIFNLLDSATYQSSIVLFVSKDNLKTANGLSQVSDSLNNFLCPILAGVLFWLIGITGLVTIDFIAGMISFIMILFIPAKLFRDPSVREEKKDTRSVKNRMMSELAEGFKFIFGRKGLLLLVILFMIINFFNNLAMVLITPLVLTIGNSVSLGIIQAIGGAGMLVGSIAATLYKSNSSYIKKIRTCVICASVCLIFMGIRASGITLAMGRFLFLFFIPISNTSAVTLWQLKSPKHLQGRIFTARAMMIRSIMPIAFLIVGPLADIGLKKSLTFNNPVVNCLKSVFTSTALNYRLVFLLSGVILLVVTGVMFKSKHLYQIEELPNYVD